MLDRNEVCSVLGIGVEEFDLLRQQIEIRMPGKWDRASNNERTVFVYMRIA